MVESDKHREVREKLESNLRDLDLNFFSSHDTRSEDMGPALYIKDPRRKDETRTGCQVSQPDIMIKRKEGLEVIEIEKSAKNPKYILGDIYAVHKSKFYSDEKGRLNEIDGKVSLFIVIAEERPVKGTKEKQYRNLIEAVDREDGTLDDLKLFWLDELDKFEEVF